METEFYTRLVVAELKVGELSFWLSHPSRDETARRMGHPQWLLSRECKKKGHGAMPCPPSWFQYSYSVMPSSFAWYSTIFFSVS
jgi:hypothetical protein